MFDDVRSLLPANPPALHYGAAVVEPFAGGPRALCLTGFVGPNRLLVFDGRRLVDELDPVFQDPSRQAIGIAGADTDGDGAEEIYLVNSDRFSGPKRLADRWFDAAEGGFLDLFELPENRETANLFAGRSVAAVDRRGDGRYSFVVANHGGPLRLYRAGDDEIIDLAPTLGLARVAMARTLLAGPFTSDGPDLFVGTEGGPNLLFRAEEGGRYREVAGIAGLSDPKCAVRGAAPFDAGLGRIGLFVGGWECANRSFEPIAPGLVWADRARPELAAPGKVRSAVIADFDNDGHDELFLNLQGEPNRLFRRHANGWRPIDPGAALLPGGFGTGAIAADLDGDGWLELVVCHGEQAAQPLALLRARKSENRWIRIAPRTAAGAPARGALVRLFTDDGAVRTKLICSGSGYLCQQEPVAHFGLGPTLEPIAVQVRWPGGVTALISGPVAGQVHTITAARE